MRDYDTSSTLIQPKHTGVSRLSLIQRQIPYRQSARYLPVHLWIFCLPRLALHGTSSATARPYCGAEAGSFANNSPSSCLVSIGFCLPFSDLVHLCFLAFSNRRML